MVAMAQATRKERKVLRACRRGALEGIDGYCVLAFVSFEAQSAESF